MPTPITETTVTFTYKIADKLYSTLDTQNKTGSATYTGPDRIWVFVDATTGKFCQHYSDLTTREDGADVPVPIGTRKIEIVAAQDPLIISLIRANMCSTNNQTVVRETLPTGDEITYNGTATPNQTYELSELTYDLNNNAWLTPPYRIMNITWDDIINARNGLLTASDGKIAPDMPDALKTIWTTYRQALRDLPTTFGRGTVNEIEAWKVKYPAHPAE